ncbi:hypothetical protein [Candidatus Protochlamydia amoebophila]|uniref:Mobile element protein n=1 Tax=Candidatus Protochlamydia amoebophila TaxID=362787 RepID=A0A0C1JVD3_9BACT|nr:hypothetical protein [Candidatus Protochlamydia amoebophila]KIC71227.1 hypothetical protein DB44_EC00030 [Candidatus Protochlamydia amoebophila]
MDSRKDKKSMGWSEFDKALIQKKNITIWFEEASLEKVAFFIV